MKRDDVDTSKREFSQEQREHDASSGKAMPGGGYPIENESDLRNAIHAIGRAKDRAATIRHIKARARALGSSDLIPEQWGKRDAEAQFEKAVNALCGAVCSVEDDATVVNKAEQIDGIYNEFLAFIGKQESEMDKEQITKAVEEAVAKATKETADKLAKTEEANADLRQELAVLKMSKKHRDFYEGIVSKDDKKKYADMSDDDKDKECEKAVKRIDPEIQKRLDAADEMAKRLSVLEEKDQQAAFAKRAEEIGLPVEMGEVLRKAEGGDKEAFASIQKTFKELTGALDEARRTGNIFKNFGSQQSKNGATAYDQLVAKAEELRKVDSKLSPQQAFAKAYEDPANAEIVKQEKADRDRKAGIQ